MQNIPEIVDYGIIIIIMVSMLMGLMRGLIREILSIITWSAAIVAAIGYCKPISELFHSIIPQPGIRLVIAFILVWFIVLIIGGIINRVIEQIIKVTKFTVTDRITGGIFGFVRGVAIIVVAMVMLKISGIIKDYSLKDSSLIAQFRPVALYLEKQLPDDLKKLNLHLPVNVDLEENPEQNKFNQQHKSAPDSTQSKEQLNQVLKDVSLPKEMEEQVKDLLDNINKHKQQEDHKKN